MSDKYFEYLDSCVKWLEKYNIDKEDIVNLMLIIKDSLENSNPKLIESIKNKSVVDNEIVDPKTFLTIPEVVVLKEELKITAFYLIQTILAAYREHIQATVVEKNKFLHEFEEAVSSGKAKQLELTPELIANAFIVTKEGDNIRGIETVPVKEVTKIEDIQFIRLADGRWFVNVEEIEAFVVMPPSLAEEAELAYKKLMSDYNSSLN